MATSLSGNSLLASWDWSFAFLVITSCAYSTCTVDIIILLLTCLVWKEKRVSCSIIYLPYQLLLKLVCCFFTMLTLKECHQTNLQLIHARTRRKEFTIHRFLHIVCCSIIMVRVNILPLPLVSALLQECTAQGWSRVRMQCQLLQTLPRWVK